MSTEPLRQKIDDSSNKPIIIVNFYGSEPMNINLKYLLNKLDA